MSHYLRRNLRKIPQICFAVSIAGLTMTALPATAQSISKSIGNNSVPETVSESITLTLQGREMFNAGRYAEAEALFRQAVQLDIDSGATVLEIASGIHNIGSAVAEQGRLSEAEFLAREALELRTDNNAADNAMVNAWQFLATIINQLGHYEEALALQQKVVDTTVNGQDVDQSGLVNSLTALAYLTALNGDVNAAINIANDRLVPQLDTMPKHDAVRVYNMVGRLASIAGHLEQAEQYYREALSLSIALPPSKDWTITERATLLNNFASMLRGRGQNFKAVALYEQGNQMLLEAGLGQTGIRATILDGLGLIYNTNGMFQESYEALYEGLKIKMAVLPEDHSEIGISFSNMGLTFMSAQQFEVAVGSLKRAINIARKNDDVLRIANASNNLSRALWGMGQYDDSISTSREALTILASVLPADHPNVLRNEFNLAWLYLSAGQNEKGLIQARHAVDTYRNNDWRLGSDTGSAIDARRQVLSLVVALWETDPQNGMNEAFEAAQWAQASEAAQVARRVAARFAAGEGEIATLARAKQDLTNQLAIADDLYLARLGVSGDKDERAQELRQQTSRLAVEIAGIEDQLATEFPEYSALTRTSSVSIADIQANLSEGEAFLMPLSNENETYVFAINKDRADWVRVNLTDAQIDQSVRNLRTDLDPTGRSRSAASLSDNKPIGQAFDADTAFALYRDLIEPLNDVLAGHETVYVVKEGALAGLPFSLLLSEPMGDTGPAALRNAPWLLRQHGFVTMPSAASLASIQQTQNPREATLEFVGFGDPDFIGSDITEPGIELAELYTRGVANVANVKALAQLPGTRQEILGLAELYETDQDAIFLGSEATETAVKTSPALRDARVVVFATHGLLAGDLSGLAEPALAFSAPDVPDFGDDGLLTASEAAQLDLVADWVILSACNTAAANGKPGGEGLSGLASSFLYAGARSLLVSHWPVRDDAAGLLTKGALQVQSDNAGISNSESLRRSMLDLIENGQIPGAAHPSTWAPFTVVGGNG